MKRLSVAFILLLLLGCTRSMPPNTTELTITPIIGTTTAVTAVIVSGPRSTVLIDVQMTPEEGNALVEHVLETGKPLTAIYITHAHIDHAFALDVLTNAFPDARLLATPGEASAVNRLYPEWKQRSGGNPNASAAIPEFQFEPVGDSIDVDGVQLEILSPLQGDTPSNTAVWIPSHSALIGGDILFNQVHLWFVEQPTSADRAAWLATLDYLEALGAQTVIAGHILPGLPFDRTTFDYTREYIKAFDEAARSSASADELVAAVKARFPDADPGGEFLLVLSAEAVMGGQP